MGQFAVHIDMVMQLAEREKNIASEINSVGSEVTGILAKIVQYDAANSSIRNRIKSNIEDISEQHNGLKRLSAVLNDCVTEYRQTEKSLTLFPSDVKELLEDGLVDSSIASIFGVGIEETTQIKENISKITETESFDLNELELGHYSLKNNNADVSAVVRNSFLDIVKEEIAGIPEDAKTAGEALGWIEEQYDKFPHWVTHGVDIFIVDLLVPSSLQTAYTLTSNILQGDLTLEEGWGAVTSILKKNTKLAAICETINYTFDKGTKRDEEMKQEVLQQITEGDVLGAAFDTAEGFVDTIIGGTIEVLGDVAGGAVDTFIDNIPVVKGINMLTEYGTGLLGWNEGDGYSLGGLIGASTEKISDGLDIVTDYITDKVDIVTDAVTDTVKTGINWVKSWFD